MEEERQDTGEGGRDREKVKKKEDRKHRQEDKKTGRRESNKTGSEARNLASKLWKKIRQAEREMKEFQENCKTQRKNQGKQEEIESKRNREGIQPAREREERCR